MWERKREMTEKKEGKVLGTSARVCASECVGVRMRNDTVPKSQPRGSIPPPGLTTNTPFTLSFPTSLHRSPLLSCHQRLTSALLSDPSDSFLCCSPPPSIWTFYVPVCVRQVRFPRGELFPPPIFFYPLSITCYFC